ncbi:PREDICTED: gastrula zinc finger protein 5-1-like isoform X2 [Dinoponera quadriceps]|uniref:Gastrula zinc finger protein 5-1-like isoform X2 n=1 Tax=Dinoponera quadriceps TaxID=609295 RepID=A0A6P3XXK7_DINQU|nr:PREDICTED: gastrula zinc finger protein 5-1-like isoform X2 [Dinoponera quadriceps]
MESFRVSAGALMDELNMLDPNISDLDTISAPLHRGQTTPAHEQRFMCGECGKGYKWMDNLRRHQRLESCGAV